VQPDDERWRRPENEPVERQVSPPPPTAQRQASAGDLAWSDAAWARPESGEQHATKPTAAPGGPAYFGPPPMVPPPPQWHTPHVVQPAPPRQLPHQDHTRIDAEEARARTLTIGLGMVAGAVILILMCGLCARGLFG
jgi:hypothetical protein